VHAPHLPTGSEDSCPRVPQPSQTAGTAGYCSTTGCHVSCAVGCKAPASAADCTQEKVNGHDFVCRRCKPGWHPIADNDYGCEVNTVGTSNRCTRGADPDGDSVGNRCVLPP
jgi:hypothetical protein